MEAKTIEYKALKFGELSEEAKQKALDVMRDINVDYDWWECTVEGIAEDWLAKYGISFEDGSLCFDLNPRYRELHFISGKIYVERPYRLVYAATGSKGLAICAAKGLLEFYFETVHYGGGHARTFLRHSDNRSVNTPDLPVDFEQFFHELCQEFWSTLEKEYDYLTSDEAVKDTIEANEYDFYEDGRRCKCVCA